MQSDVLVNVINDSMLVWATYESNIFCNFGKFITPGRQNFKSETSVHFVKKKRSQYALREFCNFGNSGQLLSQID